MTISTRFQFIIDGCNGPIRFNERNLCAARQQQQEEEPLVVDQQDLDPPAGVRTKEDTVTAGKDVEDKDKETNINIRNEADTTTILSLLRPESILHIPAAAAAASSTNYSSSGRRRRRRRNRTRNKQKNTRQQQQEQEQEQEEEDDDKKDKNKEEERIDMIPVLLQLLQSHSQSHTAASPSSLFQAVSLIFDGMAFSNCSYRHLQRRQQRRGRNISSRNDDAPNDEDDETEARRYHRIWRHRSRRRPRSSSSSRSNPVRFEPITAPCGTATEDDDETEGTLSIEITGLYEETDNVIVQRVQHLHRKQQLQQQLHRQPQEPRNRTIPTPLGRPTSPRTIQIQVLSRTDCGPGKNRRLFQPLGLLRPNSGACVLDFNYKVDRCQNHDTDLDTLALDLKTVDLKTTSSSQSLALKTTSSSNADEDVDGDPNKDVTAIHDGRRNTPTTNLRSDCSFERLTCDGQHTMKSLYQHRLLVEGPSAAAAACDILNIDTFHHYHHRHYHNNKNKIENENENAAKSNITIIIIPIVVTDDVFLRQRVLQQQQHHTSSDGVVTSTTGYVMTFHQLWHMLKDIQQQPQQQ